MKYSILIPTFNAGRYIKSCIKTILMQNYFDVEILISDDHSTDGTFDYLNTITDPRVTVFTPPTEMSMTEHWEWLLEKAQGDWIIFVGQDDGLQSYFFDLADILTAKAEKNGLMTIASQRAYYFWQGCEALYGDIGVYYATSPIITKKSTKWNAFLALSGLIDYFELPQMYTTSLFHKSFLLKVRELQDGKVFTTHPQDANLAALACILEDEYLYSDIPFGWVGTSNKSAGYAVSENTNSNLQKQYVEKINKSSLPCHSIIGNFNNCSAPLYFYGALLMLSRLCTPILSKVVLSKLLKHIVFAAHFVAKIKEKKQEEFFEICKLRKVSTRFIIPMAQILKKMKRSPFLYKIRNKYHSTYIYSKRNTEYEIMEKESEYVKKEIENINILKKI